MTDLATINEAQIANRARLEELYTERADDLTRLKSKSRAPRTLECYANDYKQLERWGAVNGVHIPPMEDGIVTLADGDIPPATILLWLADSEHLKPPTIARRMAAVKWFHKRNRLQSPTDHPEVEEVLAGFSREHRSEPMQAAAIGPDQLIAMVSSLGDDPRDARDKAILLLGYFGAFRRSELVALDVGDLTDDPKGLAVKVRRSKTDQKGEGRYKVIPYTASEVTCPVRAVKTWLKAAGISSGPVFRGVSGDHVHDSRLTSQTVTRVVKSAAERIGLDPAGYSSHSLRRSHVTTARTKAKASHAAVRVMTFHSTDAMVDKYTELPPDELWEEASSTQLARYFDKTTNPTPLDVYEGRVATVIETAR